MIWGYHYFRKHPFIIHFTSGLGDPFDKNGVYVTYFEEKSYEKYSSIATNLASSQPNLVGDSKDI